MKKQLLIGLIILLCVIQFAQAQSTCDPYGTFTLNNGEFIVQNNVWGATTAQCISANGSSGFIVTSSSHNQSSVAAYPSIYKGCHWGECTTSSGCPVLVSQVSSAPISFNVSTYRPAGNYNVATEAWLSPNIDSTDGYSGGCELMIVLDYQNMYPAGSQVGTFNGYTVYYTNIGWNFVTYVKTGTSSLSANLVDFMNDCISRGYLQSSWYLHDYEAGFELMVGGTGLTANSFSFSVTTGTSPTAVPTIVPTAPPALTPDLTIGPTTPPAETSAPTATPGPTTIPTATPAGVTADPTLPPSVTADPTAPATETTAPTTPPGTGCTCANLCTSQTAITVPFTKDGSGEFCYTSSSLGNYVNSWNADAVNVNGTNCTNTYVTSSTIPAISGVYYIYYKASYSWSHLEIK